MSEEVEKIEKIGKVSKSTQAPKIEVDAELTRVGPNKDHFDNLMNVEKASTSRIVETNAHKNTLVEDVSQLKIKVDHLQHAPKNDIVVQAQEVMDQMKDAKQKLATPNLELKDSVQVLMRNKLTHIDDNLRVALNKAGIEYKEAPVKSSNNPIERFLGLLTNGQQNLNNLALQVESWHTNKVDISPAKMLLLQIKVGQVAQELEFFSSLLNKSLESTKTIMNVQV